MRALRSLWLRGDAAIRWLPAQGDLRVESEEGQARFRFKSAMLVAVASVALMIFMPSPALTQGLRGIAAYLGFAYLWTWVVSFRMSQPDIRQWTALVLDHVVFSLSFAWGGVALAPLLWVPITISVGHGLRFGARRAWAASLLGATCLLAALAASPYWPIGPLVSGGFVLSALIAPVYVVRLVRTISEQRSEAEAKARELESAASRDALTKVLNRRGLERSVNAVTDALGLTIQPVGLIALDLDGFKAVNDSLGHEAGDAVLRAVASHLCACVRATDTVARVGGDEFVLLLPSPGDVEFLERVATKVLSGIRIAGPAGRPDLPLGASVGVCLVASGSSFADAARTADALMYEAKRGGKDQYRSAALR